jgi:hypothetical protein
MSLKTVLQTPAALLVLAIVAVGLMVWLGAEVLLGVVVVVPFIVCVWWVRNRHLTLLREAMQGHEHNRKPIIIQNKEL